MNNPVLLDAAAIERELNRHAWESGCIRCYCGTSCGTGPAYRRHVAAAVLSAVQARSVAEVKAEALREAVEQICNGEQQYDEHVRYCVPLLELAEALHPRGER